MEATWTPDLESKVRSGSSKTARGSSCSFMQLTEQTGLKLYATKLERDASYVALSVAAEHGLAPSVGQCIELEAPIAGLARAYWWPMNFEPKKLYGFLTEIVDVRREAEYCDLKNLAFALKELFGQRVGDIAGGNVGYTTDGKLVAVDIDGRFSGLMSDAEMRSVNTLWGGQGFW